MGTTEFDPSKTIIIRKIRAFVKLFVLKFIRIFLAMRGGS